MLVRIVVPRAVDSSTAMEWIWTGRYEGLPNSLIDVNIYQWEIQQIIYRAGGQRTS